MPPILPIQGTFDKAIPDNFGNAEYRAERELLIAINDIIGQCSLENPVIAYFLDVASVDKYIFVFGTDKSARLTSIERDAVRVNAVLALRMAILRKHLGLSLRKFSLALSHSDLYKWFCGINRFLIPKVPGKSTVGELENSIPPGLTEDIENRVLKCMIADWPTKYNIQVLTLAHFHQDIPLLEYNSLAHQPVNTNKFKSSARQCLLNP